MADIITFGEVMMRLAAPLHLRLGQASSLELTYGGGEANVAVSLAHLGLNAAFVSRLPENDLAQACINQLRGFGVDTSMIARGGKRMGIYFLEKGASQRASNVIYDRSGSSLAEMTAGDIDWTRAFTGAKWFHFTGITPALSDGTAALTLEAVKQAKQSGLTVSVDLNYRKKLWSPSKALEVMTEICQYVDVCIANEEDAEKVFGVRAKQSDVSRGQLDRERYVEVAERLMASFPFKSVAITLRESYSASHNGWSGMFYSGGKSYQSKQYDLHLVDRIGGGDSFAAGLIYALVQEKPPQDAIEFAVAASCLKHSIQGDYNLISLAEVETLLSGDGSGRVSR